MATRPALTLTPLKPKRCAEGWLGFTTPSTKRVTKLEYDFNGTISWKVGRARRGFRPRLEPVDHGEQS
ncbi:MAG TPA: hypothetical protein VMV08_01415 [Gaiellaceae bacterium]|nr:hypothetical protein [Gaiellaceae bacterium]